MARRDRDAGARDTSPDYVRRVLSKVIGENLTVLTGTPQKARVARIPIRTFQRGLYVEPDGVAVRIFCQSEQYEAIIVIPRAFLQALEEHATLTDGSIDESETQARHRLLKGVEGNLGRLFALELDLESGDWSNQAYFSLPSDYSRATVSDLLWRSEEYAAYGVATELGELTVLVLLEIDELLEKRLQQSARFRERAAEEVLLAYAGGEWRALDESHELSIGIRNRRDFLLGRYLFPERVELDGREFDVAYEELTVGMRFPETGVLGEWELAMDGQEHAIRYVFPSLRYEKRYLALARTLLRRTMRGVRERLEELAPLESSAGRFPKSFTWDEYTFVLTVSLSIDGVRVPVWVYAPLRYVEHLTKLLHASVLWDVRRKNLFTMMLTLINFNRALFERRLIGPPSGWSASGAEAGPPGLGPDAQSDRDPQTPPEGFLLRDLIGALPDAEAMRLIQFFLIGRLGIGGAALRRLFYYQEWIAEGFSTTRRIAGYDEQRLVRLLPRTVREDFIGTRAVANGPRDLEERNRDALRMLFDAQLSGQFDLSMKAKLLLERCFLPEHNEEFLARINECVAEGCIRRKLTGLPRHKAQNAIHAVPTEILALGVLYDPQASELVMRLVNRVYREEITRVQEEARTMIAAGVCNLERIFNAMRELERAIPMPQELPAP